MMEKMQLRQSYRNVWHTDLTNAVTAELQCVCIVDRGSMFSFVAICVILFSKKRDLRDLKLLTPGAVSCDSEETDTDFFPILQGADN
jgi:hypothetical protein